jgi:hypothetical protein
VTNIYNSKIDQATKVEIQDGTINIKHADTVVVRFYIIDNKEKVFLIAAEQNKDTSGVYTTKLYFRNPEKDAFNIDITLVCDKPILDIYMWYENGGMFMGGANPNPKDQAYRFLGTVAAPGGFLVIIKSNEPIVVTAKGVDGFLK